MHAIELFAEIHDHKLEITSDKLPSNGKVKLVVEMEDTAPEPGQDIIALFEAARASFPKMDPEKVQEEFRQMRDEWERDW